MAGLLGAASLLACATAFAQQAALDATAPVLQPVTGAANTVLSQTTGSESAARTAVVLGFERPPVNDMGKMGQYLFDRGITITANYTGEAAANPAGGISQGAAYAGQIYLGADFDLGQLINADGAFVHAALTERHGQNLVQEYIGSSTSVQEIWGTQDVHLAIFTIEQKLFDGKLDVQLGRTTANVNFLDSPIYCNFQTNSACGNPTFIFKVSNFTFFPASTWGGDAKLWLSNKVYFHAGAYEVNPNDYRLSNSGFDWSTTNATGAIMPFEFGYATTFANDELPRHYQIGGWYDGSKYSNPLYDVNGGYASISGLPYATDFGRSGMFARFDQMVWRPDPNSKRGLTAFGVFMTGLSGNLTQNQFYELGLLQQGTFPGRDDDTLGFVINAQVWSNAALKNVAVARIAAGGNGYIPGQEHMMELAYGAQLTPAIRISPNLQYIINPDQQRFPSRTSNIPNAFVIGCKFSIDLSNLGGFPPPRT